MGEDMLALDDMLTQAAPDAPWPAAPAQRGKVYGFTCPSHGTEMCAMSKETMLDFGTQMEQMRRAAQALDEKCKELAGAEAAAVTKFNDLAGRYEALRDQLRKQRVAALENQLEIPSETVSLETAVRNALKHR